MPSEKTEVKLELRIRLSTLPEPSHPDCRRCQQRARTDFRPSAMCGVRCDCTADCEEYMRYVMDRFELVQRR